MKAKTGNTRCLERELKSHLTEADGPLNLSEHKPIISHPEKHQIYFKRIMYSKFPISLKFRLQHPVTPR